VEGRSWWLFLGKIHYFFGWSLINVTSLERKGLDFAELRLCWDLSASYNSILIIILVLLYLI
jgi:hypothetical protein